ncbi:MAG TPA: hypothetical protein VLL52_23695 [Anaerolineae bacterium]|nr:hypothetical protein [Anaerolineae bacterium]
MKLTWKTIVPYLRHPHSWFLLLLLGLNSYGWFITSLQPNRQLTAVDPILPDSIATIRNQWWSGDYVGQNFTITVSEQMAAETVTWLLNRHPDLPFSHPQLTIRADNTVKGEAYLHMMGTQLIVGGQATIYLQDGKPMATITHLWLNDSPAPQFMITAVSQAQTIYDQMELPITITTLDLNDGHVNINGTYQ